MSTLRDVAARDADRPWVLIESGGNFGDELIWAGGRKRLRQAGVGFRSVDPAGYRRSAPLAPQAVVYIHGGGGLVPFHSGAPIRLFRELVAEHPGAVILGPQTCLPDVAWLRRELAPPDRGRAESVTVFCRERTSLAAMRQAMPEWIDVHLDEDTALAVEAGDLVRRVPEGRYRLIVVRRDAESARSGLTPLRGLHVDPPGDCTSFDGWIALHARARSIVTDRLHSAIVGAILGKPTTLLPGSYHKNRSIWEYSLQDRGVVWCDDPEQIGDGLAGRASAWLQRRRRVAELVRAVWFRVRMYRPDPIVRVSDQCRLG